LIDATALPALASDHAVSVVSRIVSAFADPNTRPGA